MRRDLRDKIETLPAERQERIKDRTKELKMEWLETELYRVEAREKALLETCESHEATIKQLDSQFATVWTQAENYKAEIEQRDEALAKLARQKASEVDALVAENKILRDENVELKDTIRLMDGAYDQAIDLANKLKAENAILKEEIRLREVAAGRRHRGD